MNTNKNKCCGNTFKHIDDKEREGRREGGTTRNRSIISFYSLNKS